MEIALLVGRQTVTVVVIPARAGSKSIPHKNTRKLRDAPLIQWVIAAARAVHPDAIVVTTDCPSILSMLKGEKDITTISRPAELAQDDTPDFPVFEHVVEILKLPDDAVLVHLRPTSPFTRPADIRSVAELCADHGYSVRSIVKPRYSPQKMYGQAMSIIGYQSSLPFPFLLAPYTGSRHAANSPRQTLEPVWAAAGYVDAVAVRTVSRGRMESDLIAPFVVGEPWRAVDLDDEAGWVEAEAIACAQGWSPGKVE